ncbi:site-specific integrase [Thermosynechococcaceae cyanobacterium BACA0444]|uniref:Site-specific integrase n=1 Tax=Pseudocalidococcus azoricus BACA0444 TaxID=2918990 RepID=A0AAE4JYH5_9CYAN|nr:site-specific integrase [Pseudocalidococcus azoricus]MDS3860999.1 site-specific integrase [Pseudocalidococcus azoricus BACA0444]
MAEKKAREIELDMLSGNFDRSLKKYKPESLATKKTDVLSLWERFTVYKLKTGKISLATQDSTYNPVLSTLRRYGKSLVTVDDGQHFLAWLTGQNGESYAKKQLVLLNAMFKWAIGQDLVSVNPVEGLTIKVPPRQEYEAFTKEQGQLILEAFSRNPYYRHYYPFVLALFSLGCRPGELIALQWRHLTEDFSQAWIGFSYSRKTLKATKTNKSRTLPIPETLRQVLYSLSLERHPLPDDLVFPSPEGKYIDLHNFRNRAWKKIMGELEQKGHPYLARHSFVSHLLHEGYNPITVARLSGHTKEVMFKNYAHQIEKVTLPNFY